MKTERVNPFPSSVINITRLKEMCIYGVLIILSKGRESSLHHSSH